MTGWAGKPWVVAGILAVLVALTQTGSIRDEVIIWDETTFMVLASQLLDGELPYVGSFDNKPPLIFFMLAGVMAVFGENLVSIRVFGAVCVLASAVLATAIMRRFVSPLPALAAGILTVAMMAFRDGQYTSSELPATVLVLGAAFLLVSRPDRGGAVFLAGALISMAVLTRSNLAYVALSLGIYIGIAALFVNASPMQPRAVLLYIAGGLLPLAVILAIYGLGDALDLFVLSAVTVPLSYATGQETMLGTLRSHIHLWRDMVLTWPVWFGPFTLCLAAGVAMIVLYLVRGRGRGHAPWVVVVTFLGVFLSILGSGVAYEHYWLQAMPFAAMAATASLAVLSRLTAGGLLAACLVAVITVSALRATIPDLVAVLRADDGPATFWDARAAADAIAPVLEDDDVILAARYHIVPWYLGVPPPTWVMAHPDNIVRPSIIEPLIATGAIPPDYLQQVFDQRPAFIVTASEEGAPFYFPNTEAFDALLRTDYAVFFERGDVTVHRRIGHDGWTPQ